MKIKAFRTKLIHSNHKALERLSHMKLAVLFLCSTLANYQNYQILQCKFERKDISSLLEEAHERSLDIWAIKPFDSTHVLVDIKKHISNALEADCEVIIDDVQYLVDHENEEGSDFFVSYRKYDEIMNRLKTYEEQYPEILEKKVLGHSVEGREIPVVHLKFPSRIVRRKIWIQSGLHAREWVGPASAMYLIDWLCKSSKEANSLLDSFEFVIAPLLNPDGYEYSWNGHRFWRKNRRDNGGGSFGVDLNRNWDDHWNLVGGSNNKWSDVYVGVSPASEPEVFHTQNYIKSLSNLLFGIDLHSYGQLLLRSYGYTTESSPVDVDTKAQSISMQEAILAATGEKYSVMKSAELYPAGGSADDWMTNVAGTFGHTIELRDTGNYGFNLPSKYIVPTAEDAIAAIRALLAKEKEQSDFVFAKM